MLRKDAIKIKIIFLAPLPARQSVFRRFFLDYLNEKGFVCEYWDTSSIFSYKLDLKEDVMCCRTRKVASLTALWKKLRGEDSSRTIVIPQISPSLRTYLVRSLLGFLGFKTAFFGTGYLPTKSTKSRGLVRRILRGGRMILIEGKGISVLSVMLLKVLSFVGRSLRFDVVFTAGQYASELHRGEASELVHIHHPDIDAVQKSRTEKQLVEERYCVFLDQSLPFHPDWNIHQCKTVNPEKYYKKLEGLFYEVERINPVKVVIAQHPKSVYTEDVFGGRAKEIGKTKDLVKNAEVVFAHTSTAISFAIIYRKPLCLLTYSELREVHPFMVGIMQQTKEILRCAILDLDEDNELDISTLKVFHKGYEEYYRQYLSVGDKSKTSAEIVCETLAKLVEPPNT